MNCPHCNRKMNVTFEDAGKLLKCSHCENYVKIRSLQSCPACGTKSFELHKICVNCGYDFENGICLSTERDTPKEKTRLLLHILHYFADNAPGLFRPLPLCAFLVCLIFLIVGAVASAVLFLSGVYITGCMTAFAAMLIYLHGVAFICMGELCTFKTAFEYIQGESWDLFLILAFLPLGISLVGMLIVRMFL